MPRGIAAVEATHGVATMPTLLPPRCGAAQALASAFIFGSRMPQDEEEVPHARLCYHYPDEDPDAAVFAPPPADEHVHAMHNRKLERFTKKFGTFSKFLGYGTCTGVAVVLVRQSVHTACGKPDWGLSPGHARDKRPAHEARVAASSMFPGAFSGLYAGGGGEVDSSEEEDGRGLGQGRAHRAGETRPPAAVVVAQGAGKGRGKGKGQAKAKGKAKAKPRPQDSEEDDESEDE